MASERVPLTVVDPDGEREVVLSSPNKLVWPDVGITKAELAEYFQIVGAPFLAANGNRPVSLERFRDGVGSADSRPDGFFSKNPPKGAPDYVHEVMCTYNSGRRHPQVVLDEAAAIGWAVQMNTVVFHPWASLAADTDNPVELRIDLDPQPGTDFADAAARQLHIVSALRMSCAALGGVLADLPEADAGLAGLTAAPSGRLRVDVPSPFASLILIPALPAFRERYPEIQLDLGVSDRHVDLIGDNVDCVVRGGALTNPALVARHVGDLQLRVYAAPSYLLRAGTPEHPQALEGPHHRTVGFLWARTGQPLPFEMRRGTEHVRAQGHDICAVDDGNAYLAAGLAGLGVLWLPDYMARPHVAAGELVPLLQDWTLEPMPLYVAYPPQRHVSAKVRVFIEWVAGLMALHAPVMERSR